MLIAHYAALGKTLFFQFSGGEPTLYPHILELISSLKSSRCYVGLISNGSRTTRWWAAAKSYLDRVVLTHHIEFVNLNHMISVVQCLSDQVCTHVNVTMEPSRFEACLDNAERLAAECENITLTLKPLLLGFGAKMYPYTEAQKKILLDHTFNIKRSQDREEIRGMMRRIFDDGTVEEVKASQLIIAEENHWLGWSCNIGLELLSINYNGDVYRGICKQGGKIGHITDDNLKLAHEPIICGKEVCHCVTDILTSRHAVLESAP
jgi:hypothetical protein